MTVGEGRKHLWEINFISGFNQRYHHRLEWWWGMADKIVRIAVGILAVLGFWTVFPNSASSDTEFCIALAGVIAALVLNVIPLGDREKFHGEMFRRWSAVRSDAELQRTKLGGKAEDDNLTTAVFDRILEITEHEQQLHADEPAPYRWLLKLCEGDERERQYGEGLRTYEQVEAERVRREAAWAAISSSAVVSEEVAGVG
jgi:hypothetical protein